MTAWTKLHAVSDLHGLLGVEMVAAVVAYACNTGKWVPPVTSSIARAAEPQQH